MRRGSEEEFALNVKVSAHNKRHLFLLFASFFEFVRTAEGTVNSFRKQRAKPMTTVHVAEVSQLNRTQVTTLSLYMWRHPRMMVYDLISRARKCPRSTTDVLDFRTAKI
jgi:hypothetical protein